MLKKWLKRWGMAVRFFFILLVITITMSTIYQWHNAQRTEEVMLAHSSANTQVAVMRVNQFLDSYLDSIHSILMLVASQQQLFTGSLDEASSNQLRTYGESGGLFIKTLYVVREDGQVISSKQLLFDILGNKAIEEFSRQVLDGYSNLRWTEPYHVSLSDWTVAFMLPVRDARSRPVGLAIAEANISYLERGISSILPAQSDTSFILSSPKKAPITFEPMGSILPYAKNTYPNPIQSEFYQMVMEQPYGNEKFSYTGKTYRSSRSKDNKLGWALSLIGDDRQILDNLSQLRSGFVPNLLLWIGISIIGSLGLSYLVTKPIRRLAIQMDHIENLDDFPYLETDRVDEAGRFAQSFNAMLKRIKTLVIQMGKLESEKTGYEMKMLQSQIGPHFLYNTLMCIRSLARQNRNEQVESTIQALMGLLSYSYEKREELVPLKDEIESILLYTQIHYARYGHIFELRIEVSSMAQDAMIPKFTLQPIIENAIFHGILPMGGRGEILIHAYIIGDMLKIGLYDNGIGMDKNEISSSLDAKVNGKPFDRFNSVGLPNVNRRLRIYFGNKSGLTIFSSPGKGTLVRIQIEHNHKSHTFG